MNTQLLKYAVEVEKTGSISKAAENLYINQPRLSKAIRELENIYGITVFKRTSKGVVPTKNGEMFLDFAKKILSQLDELEAMCKPEAGGVKKFDISVPRASYISVAFTDFLKQLGHEQIKADYRETNSMRTIKNVASGENNLGIIRYQTIYEKYFLQMLDEKNLRHMPVTDFSYNLLVSKQSPLATAKNITPNELTDYIEITHGDNKIPSLSAAKMKQLREEGEYKKRIISVYERASQFEILKALPDSYMWISPLPKNYYTQEYLIEKKCSFENNLYRDLLIYRNGYAFTREDKMFIKILHQIISK